MRSLAARCIVRGVNGLGGTFGEVLVPVAEFTSHSGVGAGFARCALSTLDALEFFRPTGYKMEGGEEKIEGSAWYVNRIW